MCVLIDTWYTHTYVHLWILVIPIHMCTSGYVIESVCVSFTCVGSIHIDMCAYCTHPYVYTSICVLMGTWYKMCAFYIHMCTEYTHSCVCLWYDMCVYYMSCVFIIWVVSLLYNMCVYYMSCVSIIWCVCLLYDMCVSSMIFVFIIRMQGHAHVWSSGLWQDADSARRR